MGQKASLLLFASGAGPSPIEQIVSRVQWAVGLDTVEQALRMDLCERVIVATSAEELIDGLQETPAIIERDPKVFHFGRQLRALIARYDIERPLYIGAGSTALFGTLNLTDFFHALHQAQRAVITNNYWSTDFAGFVPGSAIDQIELPPIDNNLSFLLNRQAGLPETILARTAATQFDVDTPTDIQILALHSSVGPRVAVYIDSLHLDTSRLRALMRLLVDDSAEVLVAGRVGSEVWSHLEKDTACRIRLFSEERGMRASGREDRGEVRSLAGFYLERFGPVGLFDALAELGDAAILDSRVLFAHLGLRLSAADRFYSDLLDAERIEHPMAREITIAARDAKIPVILGGHSIVSGGLWALIDAAWRARDGSEPQTRS